jgi:hypothetical protein
MGGVVLTKDKERRDDQESTGTAARLKVTIAKKNLL